MESKTDMFLFFLLLGSGLLMVGAEIFVPGAVLGTLGVLALLGAVVVAFFVFSAAMAFYIGLGIVVLLAATIVLWVKLFPRSTIGKQMTLGEDGRQFKSAPEGLADLVGREGEAKSDLRPAGFASIDGRRVDVVTEGGMIERGERIKVVQVDGSRVIVRRTDPQRSA